MFARIWAGLLGDRRMEDMSQAKVESDIKMGGK